ncbi:ABC transporter substrate-binding protein [Butyrivibrio sp.]|uniref:ABC transporter substrate-binding protein n=1 Tax=Butyrivibrio sp. TaxID=28121 RepID=UPI0025C26355|nr:DUF3502 domain-containing protein [Butyrivibrio sp.]
MKKKIASLLLSATTAAMIFSGCGSAATQTPAQSDTQTTKQEATEQSSAEQKTDGESSEAASDKAAQAIADRKAKAEKDGKYEKVVIAFFDWTGRPAGLDRINEALSAYTEETLGLDVELMIIDSAAYGEDMKLMLSSGEQVDLFSTCILGYNPSINNGYVLDLEEDGMFDDYCGGIKEKIRADYLDACRVGGVLYGTPPIKDYAIETAAVCVGQEYLDAIGYDVTALPTGELGYPKATWDDINDIFTQLHAQFPDKYVMAIQDNELTQGSSVDNIAGDYFGTLLDPQNSLKIEDVYASDTFKEWAQRAYDWNQAGFISQDALTDTTGASAKVKSGAYMAMMACSKPGYKTQISGECGRDMVVFDVGESFMSSSSVSSFPWCVNQNTEDPVAALQVLNALYTDSTIETLMCWGQEGKEFKVNSDGTITYADGVDANNSEYYPNVLWLMPNPYVTYVWEGDPLDLGQQIADFNDNCTCKSKALGFTWDNTDYASEYTALKNAYDEFGPKVVYGFVDPETGIAELEQALKAAGLDDYMAGKQAALDAWAAENGIN